MKSYFRIMLGRQSMYAQECFANNFIGGDLGIPQDLSADLFENWKEFNKKYIPKFLAVNPEKTKIGAGLCCGFTWTIAKGIKIGDIVICPDGSGRYRVGEVTGDYYYSSGGVLPQRRPVNWLNRIIDRADMSEELKRSTGSIGTVSTVTQYRDEIERFISGVQGPTSTSPDDTVEDLAAFAMEKHLEEFLVKNWAQTELSREYDIFEEDGNKVGQQYATDTGPMDILAISKDKKKLLVVELKKGRASDVVVGQVLRYMGFVQEVLAEADQSVFGVIIAQDDDLRIRRALAVVPNIDFYRYQISFKLQKV